MTWTVRIRLLGASPHRAEQLHYPAYEPPGRAVEEKGPCAVRTSGPEGPPRPLRDDTHDGGEARATVVAHPAEPLGDPYTGRDLADPLGVA